MACLLQRDRYLLARNNTLRYLLVNPACVSSSAASILYTMLKWHAHTHPAASCWRRCDTELLPRTDKCSSPSSVLAWKAMHVLSGYSPKTRIAIADAIGSCQYTSVIGSQSEPLEYTTATCSTFTNENSHGACSARNATKCRSKDLLCICHPLHDGNVISPLFSKYEVVALNLYPRITQPTWDCSESTILVLVVSYLASHVAFRQQTLSSTE